MAGPAGVGKTRLAREGLNTVVDPAVTVYRAHGSAAVRPLPLGAFAGLLDLTPGEALESIAQVLDHLVRRRPFVLTVDDAHLLDDHSALVLHRVVAHRLAPVLVTVRTGQATPNEVTALWKDDVLPRVDLTPLDAVATTELVARVLGGPVDSASAHRLWTLTQGSPLFLRHLLTGEVSSGRFTPASGIWRWHSAPTLSPTLTSLVEHEIGGLAPGVQDVIDLVTLGEPLALPVLVQLASPADIEEAERRALLRVDGTLVRLGHPLYGEVRRSIMGGARARRLRGRIAVTLEPGSDPVPRAVLTLDSDLPAEPALFLEAAEAAIRMYDLPLAERLARGAAATGMPRARLTHAAVLSWLSRGEEAEAIQQNLVATSPDPALTAMAHLHRTGNQLFTMARPAAAREALAAARATKALPLHVAAMSLAVSLSAGDLSPALADGPRLLGSRFPDDLARIIAASAVSGAAALTGDHDLLDEAARVGGLSADRVPTVVPGFGLADLQVLGHRLAGTPAAGNDLARRMHAASSDLPGPARLMGLVVAGHAALAGGRVREAVELLREAWAGFADSNHEFRFRCRTLFATALGQAGEASETAALLAELRAGPHPAYLFLATDDHLAEAWGAAAEGATSTATDHAIAGAAAARRMGAHAFEVFAWQTVVQLGDPTLALPRLTSLCDVGPRARLAHAHARALAHAEADSLLDVARSWNRLGDLVVAGDAAAQAAALHRSTGRPGSALSAAALAERLAGQSGARTPALASVLRPLPLTAREREIVALAVRGLSNREIAARLTVSVRTVEGHLYRAGHKLGVSERSGFSELLGVE